VLQLKPERGHVLAYLGGPFPERDVHAGLTELFGAVDQKLSGKQGLAATRASRDQRGPAARQTAVRYLVQAADSGWNFLKGRLMQSVLSRYA
jgi:hypothetical protein